MTRHATINSREIRGSTTMWAIAIVAMVSLVAPGLAIGAELIEDLGGSSGFGAESLAPADDGSSAPIDVGDVFPDGLWLGDDVSDTVYVNVNGTVTLGVEGRGFVPRPIPWEGTPTIAGWSADIDTRVQDAGIDNTVSWAIDAEQRRLVVTWREVGYFPEVTSRSNAFQVVLTPADEGFADFDVELRFAACGWASANTAGGFAGKGGDGAQVGINEGNGGGASLPGSGTDAVLALCETSNTGEDGVWRLHVREGVVTMPEPAPREATSEVANRGDATSTQVPPDSETYADPTPDVTPESDEDSTGVVVAEAGAEPAPVVRASPPPGERTSDYDPREHGPDASEAEDHAPEPQAGSPTRVTVVGWRSSPLVRPSTGTDAPTGSVVVQPTATPEDAQESAWVTVEPVPSQPAFTPLVPDDPLAVGAPNDVTQGRVGELAEVDRDGDGVTADVDCDDDDPTVFDEATYYDDADDDGRGDPTISANACTTEPPEGYVLDDTDLEPGVADPAQ